MSSQEDFDRAAEQVKTLQETPPPKTLLELYGLFKQASKGDVTGSRPGMLDPRGRSKYDAWAEKKGMTVEEARGAYVTLVNELLEEEDV